MIPLLADAASELQTFSLLIQCTSTLVTAVVGIAFLVNGRKSQRHEVSFARQFATKEELTAAEERVEKVETAIVEIGKKIDHEREVMLEAGEGRAREIHKRINVLMVCMTKVMERLRIRGMEPISEGDDVL